MTIKKTIISTVAAGALAAMVTGCGSSSSGSTGGGDTTTNASTVKAVDGYIINATAKAYYEDDNNDTQTITMTSTLATTDAVNSTLNTTGLADYTLSDDTNKSLIRYYSIENKVVSTSGSTTTEATFIDNGSVEGAYDLNDTKYATRFGTTKLYAPASGFSVVTPITNLIFEAAGGVNAFEAQNMGSELNTTAVSNATKEVAAILGLDETTVKTVDPTNATADSKYAWINTMLASTMATTAQANTFVTKLLLETNATTATTFTQTVAKLKSAATAASNNAATTLFTNAANEIALVGETDYVASIASMNLDSTMTNNGSAVMKSASTTAIVDVTDIEINSINTDSIVANGDKVLPADLASLTMDLVAGDTNATAQVDLLIQLQGGKTYNAGTAKSDEITVKISGLTLTNTIGGTPSLDENTTTTKYSVAYQDQNDSAVTYYDFADVNEGAAVIGANIVSSTGGIVTIDVATLMTNIEANMTTTSGKTLTAYADMDGKITNFKVALVDGGKLTKTNGLTGDDKKDIIWGNTAIASVTNSTNTNVSGSGKTLINLSAADLRGDATGANVAPNYDANLTSIVNTGDVAATRLVSDQNDINGSEIMFNQTAATIKDNNITIGFGKNDTDTNEALTAFALSSASGIVTAIGAYTDGSDNVADVNGSEAGKVELTIDTNSTTTDYSTDNSLATTSGHPKYVFTYTPTDEFTKAGDERNVTIKLNRAPDVNKTLAFDTAYINADINVTGAIKLGSASGADNKVITITGFAKDLDGKADYNSTDAKLCIVNIAENAEDTSTATLLTTTLVAGTCTEVVDLNWDGSNLTADDNLTITTAVPNNAYGNATVTLNATATGVGALTADIGDGEIADFNVTVMPMDKYGAFDATNTLKVRVKVNASTAGADCNVSVAGDNATTSL